MTTPIEKPWRPKYFTCKCGIRIDTCHGWLNLKTDRLECPKCIQECDEVPK